MKETKSNPTNDLNEVIVMFKPDICRRALRWLEKRGGRLVSAIAVAGVLGFGIMAPTAPAMAAGFGAFVEDDAPYADWFRFKESVLKHWSIIGSYSHPDKVLIKMRSADGTGGVIENPKWKLMVIYPRPSSAYDVAISKILKLFAERNITAEITVVNFRRNDENGRKALELAESQEVDLIYSMGSQSTAWLWKNYKDGKIPVVSVTSKDPVVLGQTPSYEIGTGTNFAFTSLNMPVEAQMAYIHELRPNLKNLAILVDKNNVSAMQTQFQPMRKTALEKGVKVMDLKVQKTENARSELATMVRGAVEKMRENDPNLDNSLFWITGSTSVFREIQTINANADRVPVLSVVPEVVQEGDASAAMSIGISFESNAHLASLYGIKVLRGKVKVGDLKVGVVSPPDIAINFRKVREIGLKMPFSFVEGANFIYDYDGQSVRAGGKRTLN